MSIRRYRKRPVVVDTIQWTGTNETDVQAFAGGPSRFYALDAEDRENSDDPEATATVFDKLHNTWVLVYTGQRIVRGVKREYYPIAEDVLAETYEPVTDADEEQAAAEFVDRHFPEVAALLADRDSAPFFEPGRTYAFGEYRFSCEYLATHPVYGHTAAWGWFGKNGAWRHMSFSRRQFESRAWTDATEAGGR